MVSKAEQPGLPTPPPDAELPRTTEFAEITDPGLQIAMETWAAEFRQIPVDQHSYSDAADSASVTLSEIVKLAADRSVVFTSAGKGIQVDETRFHDAANVYRHGLAIMGDDRGFLGRSGQIAHDQGYSNLVNAVASTLPDGRVGKEYTRGEEHVGAPVLLELAGLISDNPASYEYASMIDTLSVATTKLELRHYDLDGLVAATDADTAGILLAAAVRGEQEAIFQRTYKYTKASKAMSAKLDEVWGLPENSTRSLLQIWRQTGHDHRRGDDRRRLQLSTISDNLSHIINLRKRGVDIATLHNKYGIKLFTRYSDEQLQGQMEMPYNPDGVSLAVVAEGDWQGGMGNAEEKLEKTGWDDMIFTEMGSLGDLARRIVYTAKRHGPIKNLVLFAHGDPQGFETGPNSRLNTNYVTIDQIRESRGITRLIERGLLSPDCKVVMLACNTGEPGGIAQEISKKTGLSVQAADYLASGLKLDPETGEITITGYGPDTSTETYVAGERVTK